MVVEVQCGGLTAEEVEARTRRHERAGVEVTVWIAPQPPVWRWRVPTLVVDDVDEVVGSVIGRLLQRGGYAVRVVRAVARTRPHQASTAPPGATAALSTSAWIV